MNYIELKAYLDADVPTYGALSDAQAANVLNTPSISRIRSSMGGAEIFAATDAAEFAALTDINRQQWMALCAIDSVNPATTSAAAQLAITLFTGGSTTVANLVALRQETISPAQEQGFGSVKENDVRVARGIL